MIHVRGIELWGHCGVTAEERQIGQRLIIDVELEPVQAVGVATDELNDTIDYGEVVSIVRAAVEGGQYKLLERLVGVLRERLCAAFSVQAVKVSVTKPAPPVGLPIGGATVEAVWRA